MSSHLPPAAVMKLQQWHHADRHVIRHVLRILSLSFCLSSVWCCIPPLFCSHLLSIHGKRPAGHAPSPRQQHGRTGRTSPVDPTSQEETRRFPIRQNIGRGLLLYRTTCTLNWETTLVSFCNSQLGWTLVKSIGWSEIWSKNITNNIYIL